jgi:hypothetical protein
VNAKKYGLSKIVAVAAVLIGLAAWADSNPLVMSASVSGGTLSISTTEPMPKGWFSSKNAFDRSKTDLRATYTIGGTACHAEVTVSLSSTTVGSFTPVRNSNDTQDVGYLWNTIVDVSAYAELYTIHIHCDGTEHIHGCNVARPVTVIVQAFDQNGVPRTYIDDAGETQLVLVTLDAGSIEPIGVTVDDRLIPGFCDVNCGIGTCVSACEGLCPKGKNGNPEQRCANACACPCMLQKYEATNHICHPQAPQVCQDSSPFAELLGVSVRRNLHRVAALLFSGVRAIQGSKPWRRSVPLRHAPCFRGDSSRFRCQLEPRARSTPSGWTRQSRAGQVRGAHGPVRLIVNGPRSEDRDCTTTM